MNDNKDDNKDTALVLVLKSPKWRWERLRFRCVTCTRASSMYPVRYVGPDLVRDDLAALGARVVATYGDGGHIIKLPYDRSWFHEYDGHTSHELHEILPEWDAEMVGPTLHVQVLDVEGESLR